MAHSKRVVAALALVLAACGTRSESESESGSRSAADPVPVVDGHLAVRAVEVSPSPADPEERFVYDVACGSDGRLEIALFDRKGREEGPATTALLGPTGRDVVAGERLRVVLGWRAWDGEEILEHFVRPLGGEGAASAVREADPGFEGRRLVFVRLTVTDGVRSEVSKRFAGPAVPPASGARAHQVPEASTVVEVPVGEETVLLASAWLGPEALAESGTPPVLADGGLAFRADGETRDASRHPGPFWTLRARLVPRER